MLVLFEKGTGKREIAQKTIFEWHHYEDIQNRIHCVFTFLIQMLEGKRHTYVSHKSQKILKGNLFYFTSHINNMFSLPDDDHWDLKISSI